MHSFSPPFSYKFDMFHHFPSFPPVSHISFFPPFFQHVPSFLPYVSPKSSYKIVPPFWTFPLNAQHFPTFFQPFPYHFFTIPARQPRRKLSAGIAQRHIFTLKMWVKQCHEPLHVGNGVFFGHLWFYGHDWGIVYCCSHIMAGHLLVITSVITGHKWDYTFHNGFIGC